MSTTIDQRVVEMRFDNKHFEQNVSTTMSTLDKLKQKLHLDGASKGLENINAAAKKVDITPLGTSVETVGAKFSAMQVVAVTALANITNSAVNAGKNIVSALTIDPVKTGLSEYETKMGSIQTILANTEHQGTTLDDVTAALEKLNLYADKTIYNFQEMTRNIGTFTAAGVDLDTSVQSIQGIANVAAISGSTSQQASTAMYQLSQAISTGTVRLMDWNSVVNAGMGGKVFQNALIRTAAMLDGAADDVNAWQAENIDAFGSFRDSLTQGAWLTSEVLTETLKQFTMAAEEGTEEWEAYKKSLMEKGYGEEQAEEILKMANTATDAATKVKTFTQLFDTLKESAQSGWAQTWELLFGDFEEAKEFFSGLSETIGGLINTMSDYRNSLLGSVFDSNWDKLVVKINEAGIKTVDFEEAIREVYNDDEKLDGLIEKFGSLEKAIKAGEIPANILKEALAKLGIGGFKAGNKIAGFVEGLKEIKRMLGFGAVGDDVKKLQTALEELGHSVGIHGIDGIIGPDTQKAIMEFQKAAGIAVDGVAGPETLAALEKAGSKINDIAENTTEASLEYDELIDSITEKGGRELFLEGFSNVIKSLIGVFKAFGAAWSEIFPASGIQSGLFKAIEAFNSFSKILLVTEESLDKNGNVIVKFNEQGEKIVRVFKGALAAVDALLTLLGGPVKIIFSIVSQLIGAFGFSVLDVAANIGDAIVSFRDWLDSVLNISGALKVIVPIVMDAANAAQKWFEAFKNSEGLRKATKYINELAAGIKEWWAGLKEVEDLPQAIAEGIVKFFSSIPTVISTIFTHVRSAINESFTDLGEGPLSTFIDNLVSGAGIAGQVLIELGKIVLEKFNTFLSAHGFEEISMDAIAGLVNGFKDGAANVWNVAVDMVKTLVQKIKDFLGIHSPSTVMIAIGGFLVMGLIKGITDGWPALWSSISSLGTGLFDGIKNIVTNVIGWVGQIDFGTLFAAGMGVGLLFVMNKIANALSVFESLGDMLEATGEAINDLGKAAKNLSFGAKMWGLAQVITSLAIAIGVLAASLFLLSFVEPTRLWNAVGAIAALTIVMGALAIVVKKFGPSEAADLGKYSIALLGLAGSILVMAIAMKMLSGIGNIDQALVGLVGIILAMGILMKATQLLGPQVAVIGSTLMSIAGALLIMVYVAKIAGSMERDQLIQGGAAILAFGVILSGLMWATKLIGNSKNVEHIGSALFKIAAAILVMVLVAKIAGSMDRTELIQGGLAILAFGGIIVGLMAATKLINGSENVGAIGGSLLKIAAAMLLMILVTKLAAGMDEDEIKKGIAVIVAFGGIIVGLMAATKLISGGENVKTIGSTIMSMAAAILLMAVAVAILGMLSIDHLAKGIVAVGLLGVLLSVMIKSTKGATECKANIVAMTVAIGVMAAALILLSFIPFEKLITATLALSAVMGMFALMIKMGKDLKGSIGTLIVMTGAIALISGALYILATMPVENVLGSAVSLSLILSALVGAMLIVSKMPNNINVGALVTLAAMIAAMYLVVGALAIMQNIRNAEENAKVLGGLMVVLSALCVVIAAAGAIISATVGVALLGLGMLGGIIVAMYLVIGALAIMQNIQNAEANAKVLGGLMTVLSVLCVVIAAAGAIIAATGGVALTGLVGLLGIVAAMYAVIGVLAIMQNIQNAEANANLLINLMTVIGDLMLLLAVTGPLAVVGVSALTALMGLMIALGVFATGVGALVTKFPQIQEFLNTGIPIFEQLANGLGSIIGNFVAGFAGEVMNMLPQLGMCLSMFMTNATGFIVGARMIDDSVLTGVGILSAAIVALSVAEFINGIANLFSLSSSLADLGSDLSLFMTNAMPFITGASMISEDMLGGVKALAETILILTAADLIEGLTSLFGGGSSLENFATQLPILGTGLANFAANIGAFTEDQITTVACAANAIKTLAQASSEIPNAGGLLGALVGENDLGTFASQFPILGTGLASFLANVGTFTDDQVATVKCAAEAIKTLAAASSEIPNAGGLLAQIVGDNDLTTFASSFPILGTALSSFLTNVGTFTDEQVTTVDCAAKAIKTLAQASSEIPNAGGLLAQIVGDNDLTTFANSFPILGTALASFLANIGTFTDEQVATVNCAANAIKVLAQASAAIPNAGGLLAQIVGDNDLSTFASGLPEIGTAISGFVTNLGTFSEEQVATVRSAVSAIKALTELANADLKGAKKHMSGFGNDLPDFGSDMSDFCSNMPSSESMTTAVGNLNKLLGAVEDIGNSNSGALSTFADNLKKVGKNAISKFVSAFTSEESKTDVKDAAKQLAAKAVNGAESQEDEMESAGKDLGDGLVAGIEAKYDAVYQAAYELGQKAVQGEKDGQASNSPSKLTILAGKWLGEGLVVGMGKMTQSVYDAGHNLGSTATNGISATVSKIADAVSTDIDAQPTIRPVLDLSDVRSGANSINSLFGGGTSVGLLANVGSISNSMNRRGQNGVNGDVVSAIDKLSRKMDNINNASYTINGITYDDGGSVANAIETIVRAAVRERRI